MSFVAQSILSQCRINRQLEREHVLEVGQALARIQCATSSYLEVIQPPHVR